MGLFNWRSKNGGFMDQIRCDEPSYLIWKWHPSGIPEGGNNRENSIRWGSSLRVKDGEVAVFVYTQKDGTRQDYIEGPCDVTLSTKNLPILSSIVGLAYEGGTPFQAEVYFINLSKIIQVRFGVPFFDVYDPRFADFGVPIAVRGTLSFSLSNYKEFIKLHRLQTFELEAFQHQIRDVTARYVKDAVANAPAANNIPVIQIEAKTAQINDIIELNIKNRLQEDFGVCVSGFDIGAIEIDKSSSGYRQLMAVTKDVVTTKVEAETHDYVERLRIQREEGQYAMHKQAQTANIGAFQVEKQAEVGVAGAAALGKMGANGAGSVNMGSSGDGFNMAAFMASMAVGGAVGQNLAGTMNQAMSGTGNTVSAQPGAVPPPIPNVQYHVAVNGQATGPYDINTLKNLAAAGQFQKGSLVWTNGMSQWVRADSVDELKRIFEPMPPIPPDVPGEK